MVPPLSPRSRAPLSATATHASRRGCVTTTWHEAPVSAAPARSTPRLTLRHRASGEAEERALAERHAAFWVGDALEGVAWAAAEEEGAGRGRGADDEQILIHCTVPMPTG